MDSTTIKCPNCGGDLRFSAEKQLLICSYCASEFTDDELKEAEKPFTETEHFDVHSNPEDVTHFTENTVGYVCSSCGAEIMCDSNTSASECYYCHNPVILKGRLDGKFKPDLVIPFKVTRETAEELFKNWVKRKWFVPNDFKSARQLERLAGMYTPFWIADCKVNAQMNGTAKISTTFTTGNYVVTTTKVYNVDRAAFMQYEKVPADASQKLDDAFMDSLEPFNYNELTDFSMSYLSGYFADKYDVDKDEVIKRIKTRVESSAQDVLRQDVSGYTSVSPTFKSTNIIRTDWLYTLFPVWFMTYMYKGKVWTFAVNGQTGKVCGIPPLSALKVALMASILMIIGMLIGLFLPLFTG
ncbi:MAG: hypothetical protein LBM87_08990 [Ruminococcus sp.]|jgi:DNA-directed RNA polymerase subunit RPC12/RpoP|nr:hypothetical protein [Ruminococcus sp.]